jgi:CheY-like chemotaxis protein
MMKLFLSYSRQNEDAAQRLFSELQSREVYVWFDRETLLPGQDWQSAITKAISESDTVLLLLSSQSVDRRGYFQKEMRLALDVLKTIPDGHIYLLPVRLDNCRIPDPLGPIHYVDLFPNYEVGLRKVVSALEFQRELKAKACADGSSAAIQGTRSASVLLVNDQPSTMNALVDHLKSCGLRVDYAFSVPQAIEFIHANHPDVIISDLSHFSFGTQVTSRAAFEILEWGIKTNRVLKVIVTCADVTDERRKEADKLHALGICNDAVTVYRCLRDATGIQLPNPFPPDRSGSSHHTQPDKDYAGEQDLESKRSVFLWSMWRNDADAAFTSKLATDLRSRGLHARTHEHVPKFGALGFDPAEKLMRSSDAVLFLLSDSAVKSPWLEEYVYKALNNRDALVVPAILDEEGARHMPLLLESKKAIDFRTNYEEAVDEIVSLVQTQRHN